MKTMMLITVMSLIMALISVYWAVNASIDRKTYEMYYEASQSEVQALYRTIGRNKSSAYICKLKGEKRGY